MSLLLKPSDGREICGANSGISMLKTVAHMNHAGGGSRSAATTLGQLPDGCVVLGGSGDDMEGENIVGTLPFENALTCPVSVPGGLPVPSKHPFARVGVVVLAVDVNDHVLLTRRAQHMRTFPQAWVCPGGGQDAGEAMSTAAARELHEEVGIEVDSASLRPLALWESCFPTTPEACIAAGELKGHYLIVFFLARLGVAQPPVTIQEDEVDAAVWVPPQFIPALTRCSDEASMAARREAAGVFLETAAGEGPVCLADMAQVYPSDDGKLHGCGEAHMFALAELSSGPGS